MTGDRSSGALVVSVVIITFNHRPFVQHCLDSVLAQDIADNWEVVVADDCSTDGTAEYLTDLAVSHPRLRILTSTDNLGAHRNLRRAMVAAHGEFVALLEGDDYWCDATKLRRQVDYLRSNLSVAAVGHLTDVDSPAGIQAYQEDFDGREVLTEADVLDGAFPHVSSLMYRQDRLPVTPDWFDGLRGADWLMCCLLSNPNGIGMIRRRMSVYRMNDQSSWAPLPFAVRRLDHLRQLHALATHAHSLSGRSRRVSYRRCYSVLFSSILRTPGVRNRLNLIRSAFEVAPLQMILTVPVWTMTQVAKRLPLLGARGEQ